MNTVENIARICHQANRAYCQSLDDNSQPDWDDAPDWQKASAVTGVEFKMANPDSTAAQQHECWMEQKRISGWKYGEVKDADLKTHPCYVPYDQLPVSQQRKDALFAAIVKVFIS